MGGGSGEDGWWWQISLSLSECGFFQWQIFILVVSQKIVRARNKQTIHSKMRHKKGKKIGGNRILVSW
jgi:hypothetical protein